MDDDGYLRIKPLTSELDGATAYLRQAKKLRALAGQATTPRLRARLERQAIENDLLASNAAARSAAK